MIKQCIKFFVCWTAVFFSLAVLALFYLYRTKTEGTLYLDKAHGTIAITREKETGIAHIRGDTIESVIYGQGFAHAQTRLWQMERTRRVVSGTVSELFGNATLPIDKFALTMGYRRLAEELVASVSQEEMDTLQAYSDGVNDFVANVHLKDDGSAKLLPPEFYLFGLHKTEWIPWTPVDSMAIFKMMELTLTWDWVQDWQREMQKMESPELAELADLITPFIQEYHTNMVTVLDDDDVKKMGQWSEKTLSDRYFESLDYLRSAEPKRDHEYPAQRERIVQKLVQPVKEVEKLVVEEIKSKHVEKEQEKEIISEDKILDVVEPVVEEAVVEPVVEGAIVEVAVFEVAVVEVAVVEEPIVEETVVETIVEETEVKSVLIESNDQNVGEQILTDDQKDQQQQEDLPESTLQEDTTIQEDLKIVSEQIEQQSNEVALEQQVEETQQTSSSSSDSTTPEDDCQDEKEIYSQKISDSLIKQEIDQIIDPVLDLGDVTHSNNWVIHGKHTHTGMPLLANDPHLGLSLPSVWQQMELIWGDNYLIGGSIPGMPTIAIGRSKRVSWGITAPISDSSDLWQEELNEEKTKYLLDGEWKDLKIITEQIKVKGSNQTIEQKIRFTHRGPLFNYELLQHAGSLFGDTPAKPKNDQLWYSHSWGGQFDGLSFFKINKAFGEGKGVKEIMDWLNSDVFKDGYRGIPQNIVMADAVNGDIGYMMLVAYPNRKDKTPYIGNRVLDGTRSDFDWDGLLPISKLPQSFNPEKGYIVTANNRQMPDNSQTDVGATSMSTGRAQRIDEMIKTQIDSEKKFTAEDMIQIMHDDTDVIARRVAPKLIEMAKSVSDELSKEERMKINEMIKHINNWDGRFNETSIGASVYIFTTLRLYESWLTKLLPGGVHSTNRMLLLNGYGFFDYFQILVNQITQTDDFNESSYLSKVCQQDVGYGGKHPCAFTIAQALVQAHTDLHAFSPRSNDWQWSKLHSNEYANLPWSKIPLLKQLFDRQVPAPGCTNCPGVSKVSYVKGFKDGKFKSTHGAGYKMVVDIGQTIEETKSFYSVDTGNNGNLFQGNYFDQNAASQSGNLLPMHQGKLLQHVKTANLLIMHSKDKPEALNTVDDLLKKAQKVKLDQKNKLNGQSDL